MDGGGDMQAAGRVTMVDIARDAGVSKSTVSLVLQGSPLVKAETREKVVASIERLGYVYNRGAASLRRTPAGIAVPKRAMASVSPRAQSARTPPAAAISANASHSSTCSRSDTR